MLARPRFLVCEDVEQQPERSHVKGHQDRSPLHHHGLWVVPKLIPGDVRGRRERDQKPGEEEVVDGLNEHGAPPERSGWTIPAASSRSVWNLVWSAWSIAEAGRHAASISSCVRT